MTQSALPTASIENLKYLGTVLLRQPKGRGGTGCPRTSGYPLKGLKPGENQMKRGGALRPIGKSKRGKEQRMIPILKELLVQIYCEADGLDKETVKKWDLEHIYGVDDPRFIFGAKIDLLNLQMVPRKIHNLKTNATKETTEKTGITQRSDFRSTAVQAEIMAAYKRVKARLGGAWTLQEYRRAIEQEIYEL